jgi:hypothetical protein
MKLTSKAIVDIARLDGILFKDGKFIKGGEGAPNN